MVRERVFHAFKEEHRQVRDTIYDLVDAFQKGQIDEARAGLQRLNRLTGPHFRYEEESMYPLLRPLFPPGYIDQKLGDHDGAIRTARELARLLQSPGLTDDERRKAAGAVLELIVHVSDCDGLAVILERLSDEELQSIAHSMDRAHSEGLTLLEWAETVRERPA